MRIDEINAMAEEVYLEHENNDLLYGDSLELRLALQDHGNNVYYRNIQIKRL